MDYFEDNDTKSFKLNQDGREFIISFTIIRDFIRISAQESIGKDANFYETDYSLKDLCEINRYFIIMSSIREAQNELVKFIEKQKVGVEYNVNLLKLLFYISIGTDNICIKIPLTKKENEERIIKAPEEQEPFTGKIHLKNRGTYPEDEERINGLSKVNGELKLMQIDLLKDMEKLLIISEKLIKDSNLLYEENAKLNVRLQKIQKEVYETNLQIDVLKEEEQALNEENTKLKTYNTDLEKILSQKKENLKNNYKETMKQKVNNDEIDLGDGPKAVSSRFDAATIKTFIPRVTAKPNVEAYDEGFTNNSRPPFYYTEKRITQYLANNLQFNDRLNYTDINLNNNDPLKNSFRTYNDYNNPNNLSYNTYNKKLDTNLNIYNELNNRDPEDNIHKKKQKNNYQQPVGYGRISEKTNDYEVDERSNQLNEDNFSHDVQSIRESETITSNYRESKDTLGNQTEEDKKLNYLQKTEIIKSLNEEEMLLNKINKHGKDIKFNLIYKSTVDSDKADEFHKKCDKAQRTLVLIETINGKRFGGYTTQSWEGKGIDKNDDEAFIFSLDKLQIYNIISGQPAIGCYPKYGPVFLGCQIKINNNFFVKGGTTFKKNTNYATNSDFELNDGIKFFGVKDIEVFEVNLI